jgi:hypothetical protein
MQEEKQQQQLQPSSQWGMPSQTWNSSDVHEFTGGPHGPQSSITHKQHLNSTDCFHIICRSYKIAGDARQPLPAQQ